MGFVANLRSRGLLHRTIDTFRREARFPSDGLATFRSLDARGLQ